MKRYELPGVLLAVLAAGPLLGAEVPGAKLTSPILGYIFDPATQAIRAVSGVPGAASLGESLPLPAIGAATVHSGARLAVIWLKEGGIALASWGTQPAIFPVPTELRAITQVSFSRNGSFVAITDGETVETWSTRPQAALFQRQQIAGVTALAVNNEGSIAAATSAGTIVQGDRDHVIASGEEWVALVFASNGEDLIAAGRDLVRLTRDGGRTTLAELPGPAASIAESLDGATVAASVASGVLLVSANASALAAGPSGALDALEGGLVLHLRGTASVLDTATGEPRWTTLPNISALSAGGTN